MNDTLTYSSGCMFCQCECKYKYRYEQGLRPRVDDSSSALFIGNAFHVGIDTYSKLGLDEALRAINSIASDVSALGADVDSIESMCAKARAMVKAASVRWPNHGGRASEIIVSMPIPGTEFKYRGKVDEFEGSVLVDYKTVSDVSEYISLKSISHQQDLYALAAIQAGKRISSVVMRLIEKPKIRLKKGESIQEYEDRCYIDLTSGGKLVEHEFFVNQGRLDSASKWLRVIGARITSNRNSGVWLRNELACNNFHRSCEYLPICEAETTGGNVNDIISSMFVNAEPHSELAK